MKVERDNLLVIAGVIWLVAGVNILIIGVNAYGASLWLPWWGIALMVTGTFVTIAIFHTMFGKMVKKHVARIRGFEEGKHNPLLFFDIRSYIIMGSMIAFGVFLRLSGLVPDPVIGSFYIGLGSSLMVAGLGFLLHRVKGPGWSIHGDRKGRLGHSAS